MRDASSHTYHLFSYFFLSPPAYPGEREAGYGGASLIRRTAAHDTPSLQCELCLSFKNKGK